ncbi:hypothetical protein AVEN_9972-1 [Araneus ventricosus]|uniref:Uncharacterized protein n=1 Tax=Araneus ventricosus TaxID=182803 RepID=A0A4Y2FAM7_ARAVE|nr:hypothetical protein AVEN_9972-1 [Araneus ventricosus]
MYLAGTLALPMCEASLHFINFVFACCSTASIIRITYQPKHRLTGSVPAAEERPTKEEALQCLETAMRCLVQQEDVTLCNYCLEAWTRFSGKETHLSSEAKVNSGLLFLNYKLTLTYHYFRQGMHLQDV